MKHTKGPWSIDTSFGEVEIVSELRVLAKCNTGLNDLANARLIAAAPEMLEALETVYAVSKTAPLNSKELNAFRLVLEVIKKAKGES
jgi:hypothetical protein